MEPIYDRHGHLAGWLEFDIVYSDLGCPRAFIHGGALFSFAPAYLGWFDNGYFRDDTGAAVAWIRRCHGGPIAPAPTYTGERPYLQYATLPPLAPLAPLRPLAAHAWSPTTWADYLGRDALRLQVSTGTPPTWKDIAHLLDEFLPFPSPAPSPAPASVPAGRAVLSLA